MIGVVERKMKNIIEIKEHCQSLAGFFTATDQYHIAECLNMAAGLGGQIFNKEDIFAENLHVGGANNKTSTVIIFNFVWNAVRFFTKLMRDNKDGLIGHVSWLKEILTQDFENDHSIIGFSDFVDDFKSIVGQNSDYVEVLKKVNFSSEASVVGYSFILVVKLRRYFLRDFLKGNGVSKNNRQNILEAGSIMHSAQLLLLILQMLAVSFYKDKNIFYKDEKIVCYFKTLHLRKQENDSRQLMLF